MALTSSDCLKAVNTILAGLSSGSAVSVEPLSGGKNNQVWRVNTAAQPLCVKHYADEARYQREVSFLRFAADLGCDRVPTLVTSDSHQLLSIMTLIQGTSVEQVSDEFCMQTADFVAEINQTDTPLLASIQDARGALLTTSAWFRDCQTRLEALTKGYRHLAQTLRTDAFTDLASLIEEVLLPLGQQVISAAHNSIESDVLGPRILSPSDIGFHNCLVSDQLYFHDFEYAGWDSPEKLVCDFFAQPRYTVSQDLMQSFILRAFPQLSGDAIFSRCRMLMPIAHLKWVFIYLNQFVAEHRRRRDHAQEHLLLKDSDELQLSKARQRISLLRNLIGHNGSIIENDSSTC